MQQAVLRHIIQTCNSTVILYYNCVERPERHKVKSDYKKFVLERAKRLLEFIQRSLDMPKGIGYKGTKKKPKKK